MTFEAKKLTDLILEGVAEQDPSAASAGEGGKDFCTIWPKAKPVLEFIVGIISFIPVGPLAAGVLKGLIKIGDELYAQSCK